MSPQRRTALVSIVAACALIAIKLAVGLGSDSLGLVSEAIHSGTDLVAALLTFLRWGRDQTRRPLAPYGHGKPSTSQPWPRRLSSPASASSSPGSPCAV